MQAEAKLILRRLISIKRQAVMLQRRNQSCALNESRECKPVSLLNDLSLDRRRGPLMSRAPLGVEVVFEVNTVFENRIILCPILVAVLKYLTNISLELRRRSILVSVHPSLDGAKVHGTLDDIEVVGDIIDGGINGVLERSDEASPEAGTLEHTLDEIAAELHLLLRTEGNGFGSDLSGNAAVATSTAAGFRFASGLLGRWLDLNRFITERNGSGGGGDFRLTAALCCGTWLLNVNLGGIELEVMLLSLGGVGRCGWEITHDNNEFTQNLLRKGLGKRVPDLRRGAHFSGQQGSSLWSEYTYCAQQPNR